MAIPRHQSHPRLDNIHKSTDTARDSKAFPCMRMVVYTSMRPQLAS